jgi:energy-coupling factor transporter transmembrane protein EcfT
MGARALIQRPFVATTFFGFMLAAPLVLLNPQSGSAVAGQMILRLFCTIQLTALWSFCTPMQDAVRAAARMAPLLQFFATSIAMTYHYIFITGMTLSEMLTARVSRQCGAIDKEGARTYIGASTAILFSKTAVLAHEVHDAMISRGLNCQRPTLAAHTPKAPRWAWVFGGTVILAVALLFGIIYAV